MIYDENSISNDSKIVILSSMFTTDKENDKKELNRKGISDL